MTPKNSFIPADQAEIRKAQCGKCGGDVLRHWDSCPHCEQPFYADRWGYARLCKNPSCSRTECAGHAHGLCRMHHLQRKQRQANSAQQPNCRRCNSKASFGADVCRRCDEEMRAQVVPSAEMRPVSRDPEEVIEQLQRDLQALSVTNIMLDVVPGDGDGLEVYAKSVADVEAVLSKLQAENESLRLQCGGMQMTLDEVTELLDSISKCYASTLSLHTLDKITAALKPTQQDTPQ